MILLLLIAITSIFSYQALNNLSLFDRYKFSVHSIIKNKEYDRLITSAFLHADITHLFFNMYTLYMFGPIIIYHFSITIFFLIYFLSILGGNFLTLYLQKNNFYYTAIGASGGVVGVVFSAIVLEPNNQLYLFFVLPLKSWLFGILYLFFSIYGMRTQLGNIGHSAHFGGAVIGILIPIALNQTLFFQNQLYISILFIPIIYLAIQLKRE